MSTHTERIKISSTKNYALFTRGTDNRPLDPAKHKRLKESFEKYGSLPIFPIVCKRDEKGNLVVWDGQHRLHLCQTMSLPAHYVVMDDGHKLNLAEINSSAVGWVVADYARKFADDGNNHYRTLLEFAEQYAIPVTLCAAVLSDETAFSSIKQKFLSGHFKVDNIERAERIALTYGELVKLSGDCRNVRLCGALIGCFRVAEFDEKRLIQNARRCIDKLKSYSTFGAYLEMLEDIYNYGRAKHVGLRAEVANAMKAILERRIGRDAAVRILKANEAKQLKKSAGMNKTE